MLSQKQKEFLFTQFKNPDRGLLNEFLSEVGAPAGGYDPTIKGATVGGVFFADILLARDAALANETIYLGEGTYTELDLLAGTPDGVSYHGGTDVILTGTLGDSTKAIFDSNTIAVPANGYTGSITGYMELSKPTDASFVGPIFLNNANDDAYLECASIQGNGNAAIWVDSGAKLTATICERIDSIAGDGVFINSANTELFLKCPILSDPIFPAILISGGAFASIQCQQVLGLTASPVAVSGANSALNLDFELIQTGDSTALNLGATGRLSNFRGYRIEANTTGSMIAAGQIILDVRQIENLGSGRVLSGAPNTTEMTILNCDIVSGGDIETIFLNNAGSELQLVNVRVENPNVGVNAHCINKTAANTLILQDVILVAGGGDPISTGGPGTNVLVYRGVANKAIPVAVVQQVNSLTIDALVQ